MEDKAEFPGRQIDWSLTLSFHVAFPAHSYLLVLKWYRQRMRMWGESGSRRMRSEVNFQWLQGRQILKFRVKKEEPDIPCLPVEPPKDGIL